jgi:hypothetical protein
MKGQAKERIFAIVWARASVQVVVASWIEGPLRLKTGEGFLSSLLG